MKIQKARRDILRQIIHYLEIDPYGYTRLCDELSGSYYAATYVSKDKKHCILAKCDNILNPKATVELTTF